MSNHRDGLTRRLWGRLRERPASVVPASRPSPGATVLAAVLLLAALVVRLAPLGRYVTPDEPAWVYRSILFADAVAAGDWAAVPSTGHPGVTTMWLGAVSVAVRHLSNPAASASHLDWIRRMAWLAPENAEAFRHLAFYLPLARVAVAVATTLGLAVVYRISARLFDCRVGLIVLGLLAFDPFLIGHSGLLHTDALLGTASGISVLSLLVATRRDESNWWWAALSGAAGGLALATKSLAIVLPAYTIAVVGSAWMLRRITLAQAIGRLSLWAVACVGLFFAIYPAMWNSPINTLYALYAAPAYQETTALTPTFFAGQTALTHGPQFYAVALPFRLSPIVLIGLALSIGVARRHRSLRPELAWLWLFPVSHVVLLSTSPKKFDRYLLAVLVPFAVATAVAFERGISEGAPSGTPRPGGASQPPRRRLLSLAAPILLQLLLLLPFLGYPLTYFSPLFGGPWMAQSLLPVDWGEGMGAAARWLNSLPNASELTVATASVPPFASIFAGHTVPMEQASLADYVVGSAGRLLSREPAHTTHAGFLDRVSVYTNTMPLEQAAFLENLADKKIAIIADADIPLVRNYRGPSTVRSIASLPDRASVVGLLNEVGSVFDHLWLVSDASASPITADHARQTMESLGTPVAVAQVGSATISQYAVGGHPVTGTEPYAATFGGQLVLLDAHLPREPVDGPVQVVLRWLAPAATATDMTASLYLRDQNSHVWNEVGQLVVNNHTFPTSHWTPREWADNAMTVRTPEHLAPGVYSVLLTLTDAAGMQIGAWDAAGVFRGVRVRLGDVTVVRRAATATPPACPGEHLLTGGPFRICIQSLGPEAVLSGDPLSVAIAWSATERPGTDFGVRMRLIEDSGAVALEQISSLSPHPTSHWRKDDTFEAWYEIDCDPALPAGPYTLALNILGRGGQPVWDRDTELGSVEIQGRDRLFELPDDVEHLLGLTLGGAIHLRGFGLALDGSGDPVLQPGDPVTVTLYWQADGPTELSYSVFVQLVGPDGLPHGQVDRIPAAGTAPTMSWAPGQVVIDEFVVRVDDDAPGGDYVVAVGLYDADAGDRLPVSDAYGQALPGDQVVLPLGFTVGGGQP